MLTTEELTHNDKTYTRDYLRCDSCHKEITQGEPMIFVKITCGMTQVTREYHKYCAPIDYIKELTEGADGIR